MASRAPRSRSSRFPQDGSALLEALVAILIFSFGVLGLVGILAASVRATNDARYRAEAANLANALILQFSQDRENLRGKSFVDLDELRLVNG